MRKKISHSLKKLTALLAVFVLVGMSFTIPVAASDEPYDTYNYDDREDLTYTPSAYEPIKAIAGNGLKYNGVSIGNFVSPQDICYADDGNLYLADTGNNRIVVLNNDMTEVVNIIDGFDNNGVKDGFIYATNIDSEGVQAVRRLNPRGEDVIKKGENGNVGGDLWVNGQTQYAGASQITDVVYRDKGIYTLLDRKRGRIFTYDHEGNLLYIFGGLGTQLGTFSTPVAIEVSGDKLVVLDAYRAELTVFNATEYGSLINEAIALRYDGDETLAVEKWREVLRLDENNELANTGIGKAYLTAGDNKSAMKYLKLGMDADYYSIAFRRYRNQVLADNLSYILTAAAVIIIAIVVLTRVKGRKRGKGGEKA